jgi:hypothetical protein
MRVLYEAEVRALLDLGSLGHAVPSVSCLLDLREAAAGAPCRSRLDHAAAGRLADVMLGHLTQGQTVRLEVAIFGGEPLLELEGVLELSGALQHACRASGVLYAAHVITGGALLDATAARRLSEAGVARVQVGLEIPRARPSGGSSEGRGWPRILDTVAQACSEARLVLRVTPDAACDFEALVDALEERGLAAAPSVALYLAQRATCVQQARELLMISALLEAGAAPVLLQ